MTTPRRQHQRLWRFTERLHIRLPPELKAEVRRVAREGLMTETAWGYGIILVALSDPDFLAKVLATLRELQAAAAAPYSRRVAPPQSAQQVGIDGQPAPHDQHKRRDEGTPSGTSFASGAGRGSLSRSLLWSLH